MRPGPPHAHSRSEMRGNGKRLIRDRSQRIDSDRGGKSAHRWCSRLQTARMSGESATTKLRAARIHKGEGLRQPIAKIERIDSIGAPLT